MEKHESRTRGLQDKTVLPFFPVPLFSFSVHAVFRCKLASQNDLQTIFNVRRFVVKRVSTSLKRLGQHKNSEIIVKNISSYTTGDFFFSVTVIFMPDIFV